MIKFAVAYGRYLKFLSLGGLGLITAGLLSGLLSGWTPLPAALLVGGMGLLIVGLAASDLGQGRFWQQRSTEAGTNAVVATLAVLVILGLVNWLTVRSAVRVDVTENQLFTLAPQSQQVVETLGEPVEVLIFDPTVNPQDRDLLESYQRAGENFSYTYVDPYGDPRRTQEYGVTQPGTVIVEQGDERRQLQVLSPQERLSEQQLTNGLDALSRDRNFTVYFTTGHSEYPIDGTESGFFQAATALEAKSYEVQTLDLTESGAVPEDASVVVVAGPAAEFFEAEVAALEAYLEGGGGLLLLIDPRTEPQLGSLLDDWGLTLDDRIVLDTSGAGQLVGLGPAAPLVSDYGDHPITREFSNGRSFYPLARPLAVEEVPEVSATSILQTNPQSRAEALSEEGELQFDPEAAPSGPYTLGVALSRPAEAEAEARLVVIGNASFATDQLFEQQLNGDVFLNAVSWLGGEDDATLSIRPREMTNRRLSMTVQQQVGLGIFSLLVLPLAGFVLAVVLWLRRR